MAQTKINYNVIDYDYEAPTITINLEEDRHIKCTISDLHDLDENAYMYFNDRFYYSGEILELFDLFINEGEYKICNN